MTVSLKHTFQSSKTDSADSTIVQPSNWNEEHVLTAAAGKVLGRDTSGAGVVQELPIAVTAAGNVSIAGTLGIGTTTPGQKMSVVGTIESTSGGFKFPDGTTQTTAFAGVSYPQNAQNGNYTLVLADAGKHIYSANTAAQTITIPTNASVAFAIGTLITVVNRGTTQIVLSATGVTLISNGSASAAAYPAVQPNNAVQLLKTGTNTWESMFGTIAATTISHVIIAGGAGGGTDSDSGGGGAGGMVVGTTNLAAGTLTVTVGAGGSVGGNGVNSSLTGATTAVGGGWGGTGGAFGSGGGSGGGGGGTGFAGGSGTAGQGFAGGSSSSAGGGGGGASAVGANAAAGVPGNGGNGLASSITGSSVTYAGGGGGGRDSGTPAATGGTGGGGAGGTAGVPGVAGTANRGGGGGGQGGFGGSNAAGAGGSGVVIISTPIAAASTTGSPVVTTSGGNTIYQFNSSGTITF